jgi:hypothetical protein
MYSECIVAVREYLVYVCRILSVYVSDIRNEKTLLYSADSGMLMTLPCFAMSTHVFSCTSPGMFWKLETVGIFSVPGMSPSLNLHVCM